MARLRGKHHSKEEISKLIKESHQLGKDIREREILEKIEKEFPEIYPDIEKALKE